MLRKIAVLSLALTAGMLAACGGGRGPGPSAGTSGMSYALPPIENDLTISAKLPKDTVGEDLPSVLGTIAMKDWNNAVVGGFTQTHYSQTLAFPPGTKITIRNLSSKNTHTFNVIKEIFGTHVRFPSNPSLSLAPHGGHILQLGYASGQIKPGHSVTVSLDKAGTYLIGCAIHYSLGMRDILVVKAGAKPGPQASAPPSSGGGGGGGGGW